MWARSLPERLQWLTMACDPDLLRALVAALKEGRLTLLEGPAEVLPGVRVIPAYDTHTAGSQYAMIEHVLMGCRPCLSSCAGHARAVHLRAMGRHYPDLSPPQLARVLMPLPGPMQYGKGD